MTSGTTYQVIVQGEPTQTNYKSEKRAIADAKKVDGHVRMIVVSGTYKSTTTIWPERGNTYSN